MSQGELPRSRAWRDIEDSEIIGAMVNDIGALTLPDGQGQSIVIDFIPQCGGYRRLIIKHKNDTVFDVEVEQLQSSVEVRNCPGTVDGQHEWSDPTNNTIVSCVACGEIRD